MHRNFNLTTFASNLFYPYKYRCGTDELGFIDNLDIYNYLEKFTSGFEPIRSYLVHEEIFYKLQILLELYNDLKDLE